MAFPIIMRPLWRSRRKLTSLLRNRVSGVNSVIIATVCLLVIIIFLASSITLTDTTMNGLPNIQGEIRTTYNPPNRLPKYNNESSNLPCGILEQHLSTFPTCLNNFAWMKRHWRTESRFEAQGVDGSDACICRFLIEVEQHCPMYYNHGHEDRVKVRNYWHLPEQEAQLNLELGPLLDMLHERGDMMTFATILPRIVSHWDKWTSSAQIVSKKRTMKKSPRQQILLYPGFMTAKANTGILDDQFTGTPSADLIQWADIIASLYVLGHDLFIAVEYSELQKYGQPFGNYQDSVTVPRKCPATLRPFDVVYTDFHGISHFKNILGAAFEDFKCTLRIIEPQGIEAPYNDITMSKQDRYSSPRGANGLVLQQYYTNFPHTPDNSFIGFAVDKADPKDLPSKENIALLYGDDSNIWKGMEPILKVLYKHMKIVATVNVERHGNVPKSVHNLGILPSDRLHDLLKRVKLFVGLPTSPREEPAPLEALSYGALFINPSFDKPIEIHNRPTLRTIKSLNPYAEFNINKPYVYTVDMSNTIELERIVLEIMQRSEFTPHVPYEFTHEGMLQRINAYLAHQDFCNKQQERWPPTTAVTLDMGPIGVSCQDYCSQLIGRYCEPSYFPDVNSLPFIIKKVHCSTLAISSDDFAFPSINWSTKDCTRQANPKLFSCKGSRPLERRFCPCRTKMKGQVALCVGCQ